MVIGISALIVVPVPGRGFNAEASPDHFDPLPRAQQSKAPVSLGEQNALDLEGSPVVVNFQSHETLKFLDAYFDLAGVGVLVDIGKRGLCDAIKDGAFGAVQLLDSGKGGEPDGNGGPLREILDEGFQGRDQPQIVQDRGAQLAGRTGERYPPISRPTAASG